MGIVTTDNAHYAAIAAAIRERTGSTETYKPSEMAAAIAALSASGDGWTRPSSWPDYDLLDRTDMEAVFFTYDCRAGIENPEITDWMCVKATTSSGQWRLERGYIDAGGWHAVWSVDADSNTPVQDTLPTDEGEFVVYRMTPASEDGHLTRVTMMPKPGDADNTVYTQRCLERWGRLPYVTQFGGGPTTEQWGNHHVQSENIIDCTSLTTLISCYAYSYNLQRINFSGWDTKTVTSLAYCFRDCCSLQHLDLRGCDLNKAAGLSSCFRSCDRLQSINLNGCGLSRVTSMADCFYGDCNLQYLDLRGCDFSSVSNWSNCWLGCISLQAVRTSDDVWENVGGIVRLGLGAKLYPVGHEFVTHDEDAGQDIVWVVRGHDHHQAADETLTHTMTLETKCVYSGASGAQRAVQYDAAEAMYYAESGLPAGTYHFTWNYAIEDMVDGSYQFTLENPVPAGGQIVLEKNSGVLAMSNFRIATYGSIAGTIDIESGVVVTEGSEGTDLGTIFPMRSTSENLNCAHLILLGSNNYAQSAVRQWLVSAGAAGSAWAPTTKFDRPPSWAAAYNGFMHGLPAGFLAVVQPAVIPCRTNSVSEINSLDGTEFAANTVYTVQDKFFLLSRPEIYGTWDSETCKDGEQLEYYSGLTDDERKKYDAAGNARNTWLRSPSPSSACSERIVYTDGSLSANSAYVPNGVAPACIIA